MSEPLESLVASLVKQMQEQTEAINHLAASNMAIVDIIAQMADESNQDKEPDTYLDGSKIK